MTHKTVYATPSSAVAQNGTITLAYPAGTTAGDFAPHGHSMFARGLQARFSQDAGDMSVSFGASDITVTYKGATSIPANTTVAFNLNVRGRGEEQAPTLLDMKRMSYAPLVRLELGAPDTADDNGIVESQDLTSAGVYSVLAFNGVYGDPYNNEYAILDVPRNVVAAWTGNAQLTVTGEDEYGDIMVETSAAATTSLTGKKAFSKITSIATDANITSLTVGTGDVLGLPTYVETAAQVIAVLQDNAPLQKEPTVVRLPFQIDETDLLAATPISLRSPVAGVIKSLKTIAWKAVTTGGAITMKINNTAVDGLSVTIGDATPAGGIDEDTPTAGHASTIVAVDDEIEILPAAAIDTAGAITGFVEIELTAAQQISGTLVTGVQTTPTATTGDVRGTYDPAAACNGSLQFALLVYVPDPTYRGVDNYDG